MAKDYFFAMQFDRPVVSTVDLPMGETEKGKRIVATFQVQPGEAVQMKVALSTTGIEGAKANLKAEIPGWDSKLYARLPRMSGTAT